MVEGAKQVDFFISYTKADEDAAQWVAWQLEQAGFNVIIQAWDFGAGSNFVSEMEEATRKAERTIVILTQAFMDSAFARAEWAAAFAKDPMGIKRTLLPVRVGECEVEGLLGQIVYIDLVGRTAEEAADELLARVKPGRSKPATAPPAPDFGTKTIVAGTPVPASHRAGLDWRPSGATIGVWRSDPRREWGNAGGPMVEVQFVPVEPALVPVSRLTDLPADLSAIGRAGGLFTHDEAVEAKVVGEIARANSQVGRGSGAGLMVTRQAQRGVWIALPSDSMGSVFDPEEVSPRLSAAISLLFTVQAGEVADRYVFGVRISPSSMVILGDASQVGHRNSSSIRMSSEDVLAPVEDSVNGAGLTGNPDALSDELVARLKAQLSNPW